MPDARVAVAGQVRVMMPSIDVGVVIPCSLLPNGETDPTSLHGSCPTTKGEKWSATKWIHVGPFGGSAEQQRAKWCDPSLYHTTDYERMALIGGICRP